MSELSLIGFLNRTNLVLSSANVIIAFSLLAYLPTHNFRNSVARIFCFLLALVSVVYIGDVFLDSVATASAARFWLKFQWFGIALVPAVYFHFSDTILRTTNLVSRLRSLAVALAYLAGTAALILVLTTEYLVHDGVFTPSAAHFSAGPWFWLFGIYFFLAAGGGALNLLRARQRCLTSTSRRRMSYILTSVAAPFGVFPYLVVAGRFMPPERAPLLFALSVVIGNLGIALMTVIMAYGVAYHGVLMPDRVVKRSLIRYLIQGPLLGTCVIGLMLLVPPTERILGIPRETVLTLAVIAGVVLFQTLFHLLGPVIDLITYWNDWREVSWLRQLDQRLLTTTDLQQLLENILTALCDLLRGRTGFVAVLQNGEARLHAVCGSRTMVETCLSKCDLPSVAHREHGDGQLVDGREYIQHDGFWLFPLRVHEGRSPLGVLGVEAPSGVELSEEEQNWVSTLLDRVELALEDRRLQESVVTVLQQMAPEIESLQRVRGATRYVGSPPLQALDDSPVHSPDFVSWVKDALSHYWGGPKLSQSPLLRLRIVREALAQNEYNSTKAMRTVLDQALERLRPAGERSFTSNEWMLYNILEMRFIRGEKVRDIAQRLAISESDLYRKQRIAINELARQIASMEEHETHH